MSSFSFQTRFQTRWVKGILCLNSLEYQGREWEKEGKKKKCYSAIDISYWYKEYTWTTFSMNLLEWACSYFVVCIRHLVLVSKVNATPESPLSPLWSACPLFAHTLSLDLIFKKWHSGFLQLHLCLLLQIKDQSCSSVKWTFSTRESPLDKPEHPRNLVTANLDFCSIAVSTQLWSL